MDTENQHGAGKASAALDHKERTALLERAAQLAASGDKRALADLLAALNAATRHGTRLSA